MSRHYFTTSAIFDGQREHSGSALCVEKGDVLAIVAANAIPSGEAVTDLGQGMIAPGFVDLQVNGGGGVLMNDAPTVETIRTICAAHRQFGTTSLLATLITDTPDTTSAAIAAGIEATRGRVPGFAGLHIEGPHLSKARKGTHDPALIRPMTEQDLGQLLAARQELETLYVTVAPESVTLEQVTKLSRADIIVSIGHSDADFETATAYIKAGARCVTHLFNAMSQLGNREPGLVGAVLADGDVHAGLIADGFHVHPETIRAALRAKTGPARIHLVTDAMSTVGSDIQSFMLNGREIRRAGGRLTLADGTLAGADIDMNSCVRYVHKKLGLPKTEGLRMAGLYPAQCLGRENEIGSLIVGARADFLHLSNDLQVLDTYIAGVA
jgi:N-acetylglucosamine-6-phosphate deacetylase